MIAAVHHCTLQPPLFVLLHVNPYLSRDYSIKVLRVQVYVLLEYFKRALHINVLASLIWSIQFSEH